MIIDAHHHFWALGKHGCVWPTPDLAPIHNDFGPEELEAVAAPAGVSGFVAVQSQADDRDTDFILDVADRQPMVKAVVGWADMASSGAPKRVAGLARHAKLRGLRPMLQNLDEDDWICNPALRPALDAMREHRLSLDGLVYTRHLPHLLKFAEANADIPLVINHAAKPPIASGRQQPWRDHISELARLPHVFCKLSGLVTEAAAPWRVEQLRPYVDHLLASFGPARLMWGSDWPVVNLAGDYQGWLDTARRLCGLDAAGEASVFGGSARRFYRIPQDAEVKLSKAVFA